MEMEVALRALALQPVKPPDAGSICAREGAVLRFTSTEAVERRTIDRCSAINAATRG